MHVNVRIIMSFEDREMGVRAAEHTIGLGGTEL
jgi:hypothetical protein